MLKISTKTLSDYIKHDNNSSLEIYYGLSKALESSLKVYPKECSVFGVYFFDILKLLTLSMLKCSELEFGTDPQNNYTNRKLNKWPYIGYEDIKSGCDINEKKFGKAVPIKQTKLKLCLQFIVNKQYLFGRKSLANLSLISPRVETGSNNLWTHAPNLRTNLIRQKKSWFSLPELNSQLALLKNIIKEVMARNNHPMSSELLSELLLNHIRADCNEGSLDFTFQGDILLLNSGIDLQNRMISIAAYKQKIPVINIMHGEAFGLHDEPGFSALGEQMYSSAILGYGEAVLSSQDSYEFGLKNQVKYIKSNGVNVKRYYKSEFSGHKFDKKNLNFVYYPTSMSGATYRYGPYRDTADSLYLLWQESLISLFGNLIKIKSHPKENHDVNYSSKELNVIGGSFENSLNQVDVFIFDYIGTAFSEACASSKPVIYFDLGIRNICSEALNVIKDRTIYFDIKDGMPTLDDIKDQLDFGLKENTITNKYSLCGNNNSRVESLDHGIKTLF
jgi:hypothetical protein